MEENRMTGRVTIPTDLDVVPETLQMPSVTATAPTFRRS